MAPRGSFVPFDRQGHLTDVASADDFVEPFNDECEFFLRGDSEPAPDSLHRQSADLADFDPGSLGQARCASLQGEGETGFGLLARQSNGNYRSGPLIEHIVAQNHYRA